MDPLNNPYSPGAGTPPPELAGREEVLKVAKLQIQRSINGKNAKSIIMLGLRGVGKTVLLNRIEQIAEDMESHSAFFETNPDQTLPKLITEQLKRILLKLDRRKKIGNDIQKAFSLLRSFASAFKVQIGEFEVGLSSEQATGDLTLDLTDLFVMMGEAAKARKKGVLLFIDEIQYLSKEDLSALIMAIHKISQKKIPLLLIGAGLPQLAKLAGEAKSYSERLFDYPEVDRLGFKASRDAIIKPAKDENVAFEDTAIKMIVDETGGYPYFLQVWGSHVWEVADRSPITIKDVKVATKRAIHALDNNFFKVRIERLTSRQIDYVLAVAELGNEATSTNVAKLLGIAINQAAPIREEIIKKGIAYSPRRGLIAFTVPKFDAYLKRNKKKLLNF